MLSERTYTIETEQETDGRWLAEILELPGVMAYGESVEQAQASAEALAFRVLAEEIDSNKGMSFSKIAFSRT
ncbi:MAG TPA: type II toxin-antitoxin system HicB family antitoxin [Candidatus Paceibacterota bacterium]